MNIKRGTLQQFVDNAEEQTRKVLRVIHAPSEAVDQWFPFATKHLAWRETPSLTYCKHEEPSKISLLRWNDYSNTDVFQWWWLVPLGFGLFYNICGGSQLISITSPVDSRSVDDVGKKGHAFDPHVFASSDLFMTDDQGMKVINQEMTSPEAIWLTAGMRMWVHRFGFRPWTEPPVIAFFHPIPSIRRSLLRTVSSPEGISSLLTLSAVPFMA